MKEINRRPWNGHQIWFQDRCFPYLQTILDDLGDYAYQMECSEEQAESFIKLEVRQMEPVPYPKITLGLAQECGERLQEFIEQKICDGMPSVDDDWPELPVVLSDAVNRIVNCLEQPCLAQAIADYNRLAARVDPCWYEVCEYGIESNPSDNSHDGYAQPSPPSASK